MGESAVRAERIAAIRQQEQLLKAEMESENKRYQVQTAMLTAELATVKTELGIKSRIR